MELKKNPNVDIYRLRNLFLNFGLMISISAVFVVFQFKVYDNANVIEVADTGQNTHEIMDIPLTVQPPPPPPQKQLPEIIEVANDNLELEDLDITIDIEMNPDSRIEEMPFNEDIEGDELDNEEVDQIFMVVETEAKPVGGIKAFYAYVASQLQDNYPPTALRMNIGGVVYVQFVIEKDGSITQVEAVKGIGGGCDELAVEVVENSPRWEPGKQRGVDVRTRKVIPIRFILKEK